LQKFYECFTLTAALCLGVIYNRCCIIPCFLCSTLSLSPCYP
jgi:hypothetical protein